METMLIFPVLSQMALLGHVYNHTVVKGLIKVQVVHGVLSTAVLQSANVLLRLLFLNCKISFNKHKYFQYTDTSES